MKVASLQRIDRWLGVPACFLLTLARKLWPVRARQEPVRSILLVKLAEQGSTVLAYSAIRRAVEMVGRENVYFVVFDDNRFILEALGLVPEQNIVSISFQNFSRLLKSSFGAIARLRRLQLDAAVDLEFFARGSAIITFLSGAKRRVGFHSFFGAGPYRGNLMTHRLLYNPYLHTSETFEVLVNAANSDAVQLPALAAVPRLCDDKPVFVPGADELERVRTLVRSIASGGEKLILLNPNASDLLPLRKWPGERYVRLAQQILKHYPEFQIVMTGAPAEAPAIERLAAEVNSSRCASLAGRTTLRELLVLYHLSEVLVTNDSGPAHFASMTPIHVVTLFGPETPKLYAARTERNLPLWAGLPCSPCVNAYNNRQSACTNNLCMQQITVEQVFDEVCRAVEKRLKAASLRQQSAAGL